MRLFERIWYIPVLVHVNIVSLLSKKNELVLKTSLSSLHSLLSPPQAVLHAHPYHIDSLLQLSEVCKMSEDLQMAAELIGESHDYHVTLI